MKKAFNFDVDTYIFYGGYPGAAELIDDEERWGSYIRDSFIETTISKDILQMVRVDKPALLRRLFDLGCLYSGQILSYQKMLGQLQDAGNTVTLAHYLKLLENAGLLAGLQKYSAQRVRTRASSPKLQVMNTALMSALSYKKADEAKSEPDFWGRLVETSVGAHLLNSAKGTSIEVFYWNSGNREVDFVIKKGGVVAAIEVKSGRSGLNPSGMEALSNTFKINRKMLVGKQGIQLKDFFETPVELLF
jgi:predicted AAA+ superfamily ATPase